MPSPYRKSWKRYPELLDLDNFADRPNIKSNMKIPFQPAALFAVVMIAASGFSVSAQELPVEQLVAKHRDSIGTKEALAAVKNQMVVSDASCVFKGSTAILNRKSADLVRRRQSVLGISFSSNDYPREKFGFDGKDVKVIKPVP